jgi:hypothetical protein
MKNLKYRYWFWHRKMFIFLGVCPHCWQSVNYSPAGRALCPKNCPQ